MPTWTPLLALQHLPLNRKSVYRIGANYIILQTNWSTTVKQNSFGAHALVQSFRSISRNKEL